MWFRKQRASSTKENEGQADENPGFTWCLPCTRHSSQFLQVTRLRCNSIAVTAFNVGSVIIPF